MKTGAEAAYTRFSETQTKNITAKEIKAKR